MMQTLDGIKRRIKITKSLRGIVASMKTLSAISVAAFEKSSDASHEYERNVECGLRALLHNLPSHKLLKRGRAGAADGAVFLVIGSDTGLVGRFNKGLYDHADEWARNEKIPEGKIHRIICGRSMAAKSGVGHDEFFPMPSSPKGISEFVHRIALEIFTRVGRGAEVVVFYNKKSASGFEHAAEKLLPLSRGVLSRIADEKWESPQRPTVDKDAAKMFEKLVRQLVFISVFKAVASSLAAEHFTRMVTMQNAENNIDERLSALNLEYQTRRQEEIDTELRDIITGSSSVPSSARPS